MRYLALPLVLAAAACSSEAGRNSAEGAGPAAAVPSSEAAPAGVPQSTPDLEPAPLSRAEWQAADLTGELGCSFARGGGDPALLVAMGFVDDASRAEAAAKLDGTVVRLTASEPGGFSALGGGARFTGPGGLIVNIVRSGQEPIAETPQVAMESPQYPALMVLSQAGRELSVDGIWECGP